MNSPTPNFRACFEVESVGTNIDTTQPSKNKSTSTPALTPTPELSSSQIDLTGTESVPTRHPPSTPIVMPRVPVFPLNFPVIPPGEGDDDDGDDDYYGDNRGDGDDGSDTNLKVQEDWTNDLGDASGLDTSPDQGLLSPPGPATKESSSFASVVTKAAEALGLSVATEERKT